MAVGENKEVERKIKTREVWFYDDYYDSKTLLYLKEYIYSRGR